MIANVPDNLAFRNALAGRLVCQQGSIIARRTTQCHRDKDTAQISLPLMSPVCISQFLSTTPPSISVTITRNAALPIVLSYQQFYTAQTPFNGGSYYAWNFAYISGGNYYGCYFGCDCQGTTWFLGFLINSNHDTHSLSDFANPFQQQVSFYGVMGIATSTMYFDTNFDPHGSLYCMGSAHSTYGADCVSAEALVVVA